MELRPFVADHNVRHGAEEREEEGDEEDEGDDDEGTGGQSERGLRIRK